MIWGSKFAGGARWKKRGGQAGGEDIGVGLVNALLAADPFGGGMEVVVTVGGKTIAKGAKGIAVLVIATFKQGEGEFVAFMMTDTDGA